MKLHKLESSQPAYFACQTVPAEDEELLGCGCQSLPGKAPNWSGSPGYHGGGVDGGDGGGGVAVADVGATMSWSPPGSGARMGQSRTSGLPKTLEVTGGGCWL